ncbi:MAG: HupE/UreJ family protein [Burkholderiales bacterium]|nr:MAG: HupE/UreJ family protein [Burkholderiales bacterium]
MRDGRRVVCGVAVLAVLVILTCVLPGGAARAHEVRPASLEIAVDAEGATVVWKQPATGELALPLVPRISGGWLEALPARTDRTPAYRIAEWRIGASQGGIAGRSVSIEGLEHTITDALVRIRLPDGSESTRLLRPESPSFVVGAVGAAVAPSVPAYLVLGVEHILTGADHLLFVLGLLLLVGGGRRLLWTVTAFTVAHSLTLALASLGIVDVPVALVEATIALSIVLVAVEVANLWRGRPGLSHRWPWAVALVFGLLHGLGFAGALAEVGLPQDALVPALLLFNLGVEAGQLAFVAAVFALRRLMPASMMRLRWVAPYAIGSLSAYWFIGRSVAVFASGAA